jgi:hypothetical protein
MKTIIFLICTNIIFFSCKGQTKKEKTETNIVTHKQENGKPEETIKVNKHYDKNGKLVSFDSTYTSYYKSRKGDKILMDSLVKVFKKSPFTEQFPSMHDPYFKDLFLIDSLINEDFFHEDFFRKRLELNEAYMQKMMQQMDSVKNEFFKKEAKKINKK